MWNAPPMAGSEYKCAVYCKDHRTKSSRGGVGEDEKHEPATESN